MVSRSFHQVRWRKVQRRLWKDAGGKLPYLDALDISALPSIEPPPLSDDSDSDSDDNSCNMVEEDEPLTLVLRRV